MNEEAENVSGLARRGGRGDCALVGVRCGASSFAGRSAVFVWVNLPLKSSLAFYEVLLECFSKRHAWETSICWVSAPVHPAVTEANSADGWWWERGQGLELS